MNRALIIVLAIIFGVAGCGGSAPVEDRTAPPVDLQAPDAGLFESGASLSVVRSASGAPQGIALTWLSVDDTATSGPYITDYHIYKSASPIPDDARGNSALWVEINASTDVPQPAVPGDPVGPVTDLFAAQYGETWYYRLSAVAADGDESVLSPEAAIVVAPFDITSVAPASLGVGDQFTITGNNFGAYDPVGDQVQVRGVEWVDGTGFVPALLAAPIVPALWTSTSITAILPLGATTGPVDLTIAGITVTSADTIGNSDPYITSLAPLSATIKDTVVLQGANFGAAMGPGNFVEFGPSQLTDPTDYASYTDTEIQFHPPVLLEFVSHEVVVHAGSAVSNSGYCRLTNLPPVAYLTVNPAEGDVPLSVVMRPAQLIGPGNWEYSYDPEGVITEYRYDFDGDGTDDFTTDKPDDVFHIYTAFGEYFARLTVVDSEGLENSAQFRVTARSPRLTLTFVSAPPPGNIYADTPTISVQYEVAGGAQPISVDWILVDAKDPSNETLLSVDPDVPPGTMTKTFVVDTSTNIPAPGSGAIPRGSWQVRAEGHDADPLNDPDGGFIAPQVGGTPGQWDVYRLNIGVVADDQADPGDTESLMFLTLLTQAGYQVTMYPQSTNIDPATMINHHAVVWATAGPAGSAVPFEWLDVTDQVHILMLCDLGVNVVVFGLPGVSSGGNPVFAFPPFNDLYQPFGSVTAAGGPLSLTNSDYTLSGAFGDHFVTGFDTGPELGYCPTTGLQPGSTSQSGNSVGPSQLTVAADRPTPGGSSRLYFGMYVFSQANALLPAGVSPADLLDNILTGIEL